MNAVLNSRKHLYAAAAGLCLAVLLGGWFLFISPKKAQVADIRSEVSTQESTNNSLRSQVQALQVLQAKLPQQQASLAQMQSKVPNEAALPELLRTLNQAAIASGVKLTGVAPTPPAAIPNASGVSGVDVTLKVTGDYVALEEYQLALERLPRAFLVRGMAVASGTSTSSTPGSASGGDLTATINGRVLLQTTSPVTTPPQAASTTG
jgi:Tfp pilus assembly protein PilO